MGPLCGECTSDTRRYANLAPRPARQIVVLGGADTISRIRRLTFLRYLGAVKASPRKILEKRVKK